MKKYVILLCLLFSITACGNKVETPESDKKNEEIVETTKEEPKEEQEETKVSEKITVPDVSNLTVQEAIKKLQESGFLVDDTIKEEDSDSIAEGRVVKTIPSSGSIREKETIVTIYVSKGTNKFVVENYVGKNYLEVKATLEAHNIKVVVETKNTNFAQGENIIIEQSVAPGKTLNPGDKITLYIPIKLDTYPDFTNGDYTIEQVKKFCAEYDVILSIQEVPSNDKSGTIIQQSRPVGSKILGNQTLSITVAK